MASPGQGEEKASEQVPTKRPRSQLCSTARGARPQLPAPWHSRFRGCSREQPTQPRAGAKHQSPVAFAKGPAV